MQASVDSTLAEVIAERIQREEKITFREWMSLALYHPTLGYYSRADLERWGRAGDYRTSPESSALFATTFAHYFVKLYERMGRPAELKIIEFGAGNGQFAYGVLKTLRYTYPSIFNVTNYSIVEVSNDSTTRANDLLSTFADHVRFADLDQLEKTEAGIVFSNELLDSFPVHRVKKISGELKELYVALSPDDGFVWLPGELSYGLEPFCDQYLAGLKEGQSAEVSPDIAEWFAKIQKKLLSGFVVTVDYGAGSAELYNDPNRFDGTLRGYRRHEFVEDILSEPGAYDLTSTINWNYVQAEGERYGFACEELGRLDRFLIEIGLPQELERQLMNVSSGAERVRLTTSAREMILPGGMAESFAVMVQKR
jgi:SAM-dependent MidA family methyltransferase